MIFGKHINRYYLRYGPMLLLGLVTLVAVDYLQLIIPELYQMVVDGMYAGSVTVDGVVHTFNMEFLLDSVCMPMVGVILCVALGRFLWRVCFFGAGIKVEAELRNRMFDHAKDLSREYYQVNKVGNLMSLFTNDLDTIQECFGWGFGKQVNRSRQKQPHGLSQCLQKGRNVALQGLRFEITLP